MTRSLFPTVFACLAVASTAAAQTVLPPSFSLEDVVTSGLHYPTSIAFAPEGLLYIAEKGGTVRVWRDGTLRSLPFADLSSEVNQHGDRGLAGIAVHPEFPETPFVYLSYSYDPPDLPGAPGEPDGPDGNGRRLTRLVRVLADAATNWETMVEGSTEVIFGAGGDLEAIGDPGPDDGQPVCERHGAPIDDCGPSESHSHSINSVRFGPDGALWFSHGEGSNALIFDPRALRAQDLDRPSGKILRVDPLTGSGLADNPFFNGDPAKTISKVWSYGLRNPFRFSFHPATGGIYIGDVGWNRWEEINRGRGKNFGWPCYEGELRQPAFENHVTTEEACRQLYESGAATLPFYFYPRPSTGGALILGDFFTGDSYPTEYRGALFFADFNDQWIRYLVEEEDGRWSARPFAWLAGAVVQIAQAPDGDLYIVSIFPGDIRRLVYQGSNRPPEIFLDATPQSGAPPLEVQFWSAGTHDPDGDELTFLWDFDDGATSTEPNPTHTFADPGSYRVRLTVTDGGGARSAAGIEISAGVSSPTAMILAPARGTTYAIGDEITLQGRAVDPEEGELEEESLEWEAILHHAGHVHPNWFSARGNGARITIEDHGDDTWMELVLTASDSGGSKGVDRMSLHSRRSSIVLESSPPGLQLVYESDSREAPFSVDATIGGRRTISAPRVQSHLSFVRWSDGGDRSREIDIDGTLQAFTARYENHAPTAVARFSVSGDEGLTLHCHGSDSFDPEGDELEYLWDFGDGSGSAEPNPTHVFSSHGTYVVTLRVTDQLGSIGVVERRVVTGQTERRRAIRRRP